MRLPAYSASAKVICFIEKLGDWCPEILPNQEVFFRISLDTRVDYGLVHLVSGSRTFRSLSTFALTSCQRSRGSILLLLGFSVIMLIQVCKRLLYTGSAGKILLVHLHNKLNLEHISGAYIFKQRCCIACQ
ncbi:hypothetical protein DA482_04660 [Pseudomonas fluorescens]|nr:hypothetical protein D0N73_20215 [Pseudomonas fluorescens]